MSSNILDFYLIRIILCLSLIFLSKFLYRHIRIWCYLIRLPGPKGNFFTGQFFEISGSSSKLLACKSKWSKEFSTSYCIRVFSSMSLNISSPEDYETFFSSKKHTKKSLLYDIFKNWLRDGLLLSDGPKWLKRRRILTPAFHFNILKDFVSVFNEETEKVIEEITKKINEPIDVVPITYTFSLKSLCRTSMGRELDTNFENHRDYLESITKIEDHLRERMLNPFLHFSFIWKYSNRGREEKKQLKNLHNFTRNVINERMREFKGIPDINTVLKDGDDDIYMGNKRKRLAMLDIMLQAKMDGEEIDYEGICEEVDTFMFEGHDTTGAAMGFCLMLLANHPEIQEQVYNEIIYVLDGENRNPNYNDLQKMELLERVIKETLRLYPSVHTISRKVDEDVVLKSGFIAPKDSHVNLDIFFTHRNPEIYPEPEKFDPDRFLPEICKQRHPYAFVPFSAGPRNCIGQKYAMMEMKCFIMGIMRRFDLKPVDTPENIVLRAEVILRTVGGIRAKFIPRF